jgi:lipopolysaccharide export system protein LptA
MIEIAISVVRRTLIGALLLGAVTCIQAQTDTAAAKPNLAPTPTQSPNEPVSTFILSDTLHYDEANKVSLFTGKVTMTRGLLTLSSDRLEMREDAAGNQFGIATVNGGHKVVIHQKRPENFEIVEGQGLRAEYDGAKSQFDLIGQAIVTRFICGKPIDTIHGDRVRYNEKSGTYEAQGGPNSSAVGGRVRSLIEPKAKVEAAMAECRQTKQWDRIQPPAS